METRYDPKSGAHEAIPEGDEIFCKYIVFAISEILQRISGAESCIFSWWRLFGKSLPQEVDPTPLTQRFQPGKCCKLFDSEVHKCTIRGPVHDRAPASLQQSTNWLTQISYINQQISHQWTHKTSNHALIRWNSTIVEETRGPCHFYSIHDFF